MRIKTLFSIPDGEKVTEKALRRVLISSICSILLCMTCLVSTTWAWFTVSVENTGNVIEIATVKPKVTINGDTVVSANGGHSLSEGEYSVAVELENNATELDAFGIRSEPVYFVMSVVRADNTSESYFIKIENGCDSITRELTIGGEPVTISFCVSWVQPVAAKPIENAVLLVGEIPTEPTDTLITEVTSETATEDSIEFSANATEDPTKEPSTETVTELPVGIETDSVAGSPTDDATEVTEDPSAEPSIVPLPE